MCKAAGFNPRSFSYFTTDLPFFVLTPLRAMAKVSLWLKQRATASLINWGVCSILDTFFGSRQQKGEQRPTVKAFNKKVCRVLRGATVLWPQLSRIVTRTNTTPSPVDPIDQLCLWQRLCVYMCILSQHTRAGTHTVMWGFFFLICNNTNSCIFRSPPFGERFGKILWKFNLQYLCVLKQDIIHTANLQTHPRTPN